MNNNTDTDSNIQNLDWNKSYYLDIEMIDKQHDVFFRIFDQLKELNVANESYDKLKELIFELKRYTIFHFQIEEELLAKSNYADIEKHILQHQIFKKKVDEFVIAETYHNSVLIGQMIVFLRKWFLLHIAEVDRNYVEDVKRFLSEKSSKKTFAQLSKALIKHLKKTSEN